MNIKHHIAKSFWNILSDRKRKTRQDLSPTGSFDSGSAFRNASHKVDHQVV